MKIAFLANPHCVHTTRWAEALMERGWDIQVLTVQRCSSRKSDLRVWQLPFGRPWGYIANCFHARKLLRKLQPDIVHSHYASGYGTLARLTNHRPCILSVWGSDVFTFPDKSPFHRRAIEKNLGFADLVCSTGHVMARRTRELCGRIRQLEVTPFGVDVRKFIPKPVQRPGDAIVIGTVKTLEWTYGIDVLIRAFADSRSQIASTRPDMASRMRLLIVGGGSKRAELEQLSRQCGIGDVTTFVGPVPHNQVPDYLNKIDVYCALSRSESFGVAVLEASACGIPVIVSDVGGLPEVVIDGVTGHVVEGQNVPMAADAVAQLILDPGQRGAMGQAGRAHVVKNYEWRDSILKMESVYSTMLALRSRLAA